MTINEIENYLKSLATSYLSDFASKIIPTNTPCLGVKTGDVKSLAKTLAKLPSDEVLQIIKTLPIHKYTEMDSLKGFLISYSKLPFATKEQLLHDFAYEIDNWGACDTVVCSTTFKKNELEEVHRFMEKLLDDSNPTFVKRFGAILMLKYFVKDDVETNFKLLNKLTYGEYYLDMGVAWFWSVALVHDFESATKYLRMFRPCSEFVYQKSLQKGVESFRITDEQKTIIRQMKKESISE